MASIRGVNVPMYTTLRRTTVFFTLIMEFLLVGQKHSNPIIARSVSSQALNFQLFFYIFLQVQGNFVK